MLSNHLHNGIQTAKIVWSRVPSSEEGEPAEVEFASRSHGGTGAESLDYEVIENYAYRKEQVEFALGAGRKTLCFVLCGPQMVVLFSYWHRYALLGAASFLGGPMRMTVSLCVIMVEITNNLKLLPLIMLVLLISKAVGDFFNKGLYEEQAQLRGIPLLESRPKQYLRNRAAKEACMNQKVVYFPRVVKVRDIISVLWSNKHNGFPVSQNCSKLSVY